ncbi:MAG TPA: T9SS type A sorting domain-containing protein [Candidatus Marinimicrobia bacterium]|nr:T9SS type A sorting domain-containing protein [Candidatus Neomarinimicrobiota bacterium]
MIIMLKRLGLFLAICSSLLPQQNKEFRATWVITWDHIDRNAPAHINKAHVQTIMDNHKEANMNAVLFQVRQGGTAYYTSSYEPWGYYAGYQYPGYDPLEYAIQEAHKRGLELHAWFNVFQCSSTYEGAPAAEHPEWICRDQDGYSMDSYRSLSPGLEDVRAYTIDVAMEIVNNYDIDGLHLDYIRWNEHSNSLRGEVSHEKELQRIDGIISDEELEALNNNRSGRYLYDYLHPYSAGVPDGFSSWEEWWRGSVTEFVNTLHDSIQVVKPHVRLSVAALGKYNWSGWQGYGSVYQDAALWFNEGYIDQLMPMHYHWYSAESFYGMLEGNCPECWGQYIQPGINDGLLFTVGPGSYILEEYNVWDNHDPIVETCRTIPWVDGFQFFSYRSWDDRNYWYSAGNSFFSKQTKIRNIPGNYGSTPDAPSLILTYIDSVTHDLTVIPSNANENTWSILYRSKKELINSDESEIIDIQFGGEPYTIQTGFSNVQDSTALYIATKADRFWNESDPSNIVFASRTPLPAAYSLGYNFPNPFNSTTIIPFSLPDLGFVQLDIYDLVGRHVISLVDNPFIPGEHTIIWNARHKTGSPVSSGVYICKLSVNEYMQARPMIYIK